MGRNRLGRLWLLAVILMAGLGVYLHGTGSGHRLLGLLWGASRVEGVFVELRSTWRRFWF